MLSNLNIDKFKEVYSPLKEKYINKKTGKAVTKRIWSVYRWITVFCISMILLFPVIYMISVCIRPVDQMSDPMVIWIPKSITFEYITSTFQIMDYSKAFFTTFKLTIISSLLSIASCALAGYGFARFKFKFKNILFMLVLFMLIVSPQNILIAMYRLYKDFDFFGIGSLIGLFTGKALTVNLLGNDIALYLPSALGAGIKSALFILIFTKFFSNLPKELEDAAYIDGCGLYKTFVKVMLPNAIAPLVVVFLFSAVWHWNDYFYTSVYLQNASTLSNQLPKLAQMLEGALRPAGSGIIIDPHEITIRLQVGCLLTITPPLILYMFMQKSFTESVERTGIVG